MHVSSRVQHSPDWYINATIDFYRINMRIGNCIFSYPACVQKMDYRFRTSAGLGRSFRTAFLKRTISYPMVVKPTTSISHYCIHTTTSSFL